MPKIQNLTGFTNVIFLKKKWSSGFDQTASCRELDERFVKVVCNRTASGESCNEIHSVFTRYVVNRLPELYFRCTWKRKSRKSHNSLRIKRIFPCWHTTYPFCTSKIYDEFYWLLIFPMLTFPTQSSSSFTPFANSHRKKLAAGYFVSRSA